MILRKITDVKRLNGKRVILRCDFNVEPSKGTYAQTDLWRLRALIPTVQYLLRKNAIIILVAHRGRPNGIDNDLTLEPIVKKFSSMIKRSIPLLAGDLQSAAAVINKLRPGRIAALENIRFYAEEEANDAGFGKKLAQLGDLYVNDAFGNLHRSHASMVAITRHLPSYAGLLLEHELGHLHNLLERAKKPIVAIIGGSKISTKIRLIKRLMKKVDHVLLGGALANNVLAAMEHTVGKSVVEADMIEWSKGLLHNKLRVPVDARVATSLKTKPRIEAVADVKKNDIILDLGPDTIALYREVIATAKTVIWNGPLGLFEDARYAKATNAMVNILTNANARSFVGGGETVRAVLQQGAEDEINFVSTGGGAMLALLEGRPLPALRALIKKR